jgi:hypothetical protein
LPVFKYRDVSEMTDVWREPGDPLLFRAIARVWALSARLAPYRYPPGVHRVRNIEDSNRLTETWDAANFRAFQGNRRGGGEDHGDQQP